MREANRVRAIAWLGVPSWLGFLVIAHGIVFAEQLPLKLYTTADGLARDGINRIVRDSRGFLWFCTQEGLSRFDGYTFTNYTTDHGLPNRNVNDLLETHSGVYWVATGAGLCRFNPAGPTQARAGDRGPAAAGGSASGSEPMFVVYNPGEDESSRHITVLVEDRQGQVWCGTGSALYRLEQSDGQWTLRFVDVGIPAQEGVVATILVDKQGALWVGDDFALYRRWPDGRVERYTKDNGLPEGLKSFFQDREGRLWLGTNEGLCLLVPEPEPNRPIVARMYTTKDGLGRWWVRALLETPDGHIWAGTGDGLSELASVAGEDPRVVRTYTTAEGLSRGQITALSEDRDGSLWIGTEHDGVMKLARDGFTTYNEPDGLGSPGVTSIFETQRRELCATYSKEGLVYSFGHQKFTVTRPRFPRDITYFGWGTNQVTLRDHLGQWWIPTGQGLCRFPNVSRLEELARTLPVAVYTTKDGLPGDDIFHLFEDSRGDIWISSIGSPRAGLTRWERATETLRSYPEADNAPQGSTPTSFCEDSAGSLWVGTNSHQLDRYSAGRFTFFTAADGLPAGWVRALCQDHAGRLWIATGQGGLARIDDPSVDRPRFITYTTANGLSSNEVDCITEDQWGRIYAGTGRGVDRLDPATGRIKHYTAADGLVRGELQCAFRDHQGTLWFASTQGLSRLTPQPDRPPSPPPILISGLRIAGTARSLSALGETEVAGLVLGPNQSQVQIDFFGLGLGPGEELRYQYMLEGADRDWTAPADQRTVNYANLRPGSYRFLVRALTADGAVSEPPAVVAFRILPPIWQRWYFLAPAALLIGLMIYGIYRYRVARLIELAEVRTRIATDLHDDIGSSLSRMAILSEVVKQRIGPAGEDSGDLLTEIAESGRRLVDTMSDIVWAIDPRRDDLSNLAARVREFAAGMLDAKPIKWSFEVPPELDHLKLGPDERRQVFLILKEAITNVARHARCGSVSMTIAVSQNRLFAEVTDDGCGFSTESPSNGGGGEGLESMKSRAAHLGGQVTVVSALGRGTCLKLEVPVRRQLRE